MALTYRLAKGSALTIEELDANFAHFTGSNSITGSLTVSGSLTASGSTNISGLLTITNQSGSVLTPTASLVGIAPTFNGVDGQFLFGSGSHGYKIFVWLGGAWRSSSLA